MNWELVDFVKKVQGDKRFLSLDEAATKQGIVLKVLSFLGWDPFEIDEIHPEYTVGSRRVDFSLRHNNSNRVFISVARVGKELEPHQESLLNFASAEEVKMAILSNGLNWWFYLPYMKGNFQEKRFHEVDFVRQSAEDIVQRFSDFLSKEFVVSGLAVKNAETVYNLRQREHLINESIPRAWSKLLSEPEEWLVDLLAEATKKVCGYRPDNDLVAKFIANEIDVKSELSGVVKPRASQVAKPRKTSPVIEDYTGRSILSFSFKGRNYDAGSWKDMLLKVCEIVYKSHRGSFEAVLTLAGRNRHYFTRNSAELLTPEKIAGTDIYVETNLSAMGVVALSNKILSLFGYNESDLSIEAK